MTTSSFKFYTTSGTVVGGALGFYVLHGYPEWMWAAAGVGSFLGGGLTMLLLAIVDLRRETVSTKTNTVLRTSRLDTFSEIEKHMRLLPLVLESTTKQTPLYVSLSQNTGVWRTFEGDFPDAIECLRSHIDNEFPAGVITAPYQICYDDQRLRILAVTGNTGFPHYVWKVANDRFLLLLPNNI